MLPLHNLKFIKSFFILKLILFLHRARRDFKPKELRKGKKISIARSDYTYNFKLLWPELSRSLSDLNFSYSLNFCLTRESNARKIFVFSLKTPLLKGFPFYFNPFYKCLSYAP